MDHLCTEQNFLFSVDIAMDVYIVIYCIAS